MGSPQGKCILTWLSIWQIWHKYYLIFFHQKPFSLSVRIRTQLHNFANTRNSIFFIFCGAVSTWTLSLDSFSGISWGATSSKAIFTCIIHGGCNYGISKGRMPRGRESTSICICVSQVYLTVQYRLAILWGAQIELEELDTEIIHKTCSFNEISYPWKNE